MYDSIVLLIEKGLFYSEVHDASTILSSYSGGSRLVNI